MKTKTFVAIFLFVILLFSCRESFPDSKITPVCDWGKEESVSFDKIEFTYNVQEMSQSWRNQYPADNVIRDLWTVLQNNGDLNLSSNKARVFGTITGGQGCIGTKQFSQNTFEKVSPKSVKAPFPNNGFVVNALVTVRSDDYRSTSGNGDAYYVFWTRNSNTLPVNGKILGKTERFWSSSGALSKQGYIIQGGTKIYL